MTLQTLNGTKDILPEEAERWQRLEAVARRVLHLYGYQEVRTPLIEEAAVFTNSLGEAAEIVTKQMYLFQDRGGRQVALRPEGTASVVRAFIQHGLDRTAGLSRFYYVGPMFRAERPQAGRQRQFHQLGVEVFGSASPYQDVEVVLLLSRLLTEWNLEGWELKLNSLGCRQDRKAIVEHVRAKLLPARAKLCPDCQARLEKNPLRILDCKEPGCRELSAGVDVYEAVCPPCREHFTQVTQTLTALKVPFERDPHLVRGLDYYTRTAFEVVHGSLGAQDAMGGGGRYDDLVQQMGGASVPAVGFAVGLERILMAQKEELKLTNVLERRPHVFIASAGTDLGEAVFLAEALRSNGISAVANVDERPLRRQLEQADKWECDFVVIRGELEKSKRIFMLKDMTSGAQIEAPEEIWVETLQKCLGKLSGRIPAEN